MARSHKLLSVGVFAIGLSALLVSWAAADGLTRRVQHKFRGRLIVTTSALSVTGRTQSEAVKAIKAAHQKAIAPARKDGGVAYYSFYWTAFMRRKPRATSLSLEFYKKEGGKVSSGMSANKGLTGISPNVTILRGQTQISEDDGVTAGKTYKVKLVATIGGRDHTLASTFLTFK